MKKTVSILIASAIALSQAVTVFAQDTFSDVNSTSYAWAYQYVEDMAEKGLISGYEDGTYKPGKSVSRMEAFALFARLMGSNNETNVSALENAKEQYADILKDYDLSYAEGDVAFMLYRGVIEKDELDIYFKGDKKSEAMPRYEAAILITKAMLKEAEAKAEVLIDMDYTDVTDIPKEARQYVYYVSKAGIMSGMGNGEFSPNTSVLRGQIAVMLSKTVDSASYFTETAALVGIDVENKNLKIRDGENKEIEIGYADTAKFYVNGKLAKDTDLASGQTITLTYTNDGENTILSFADAYTNDAEEYLAVIYRGYSSNGGKLMVLTENTVTGEQKSYECSATPSVVIDGDISDINNIQDGDYVNLGMSDGLIVTMETMPKTVAINGAVLTKLDSLGAITIEHEDLEFDGETYKLASRITISKNGKDVEFTALYRGDTLDITLQYGLVSKIVAESQTSTVEGVLKSYTISATPTLTIRSNGQDLTYDIPTGIEIKIDGEKAKLADFEIGTKVTVTIESDAVQKVEADASAISTVASSVTGKVASVNENTRAIMVVFEEAGEEVSAYVNCTEDTKYQVIPTLDECELGEIKVGYTITAYGSYTNGIFVSTGIIVTPSVK